jgi:hypothetical protein
MAIIMQIGTHGACGVRGWGVGGILGQQQTSSSIRKQPRAQEKGKKEGMGDAPNYAFIKQCALNPKRGEQQQYNNNKNNKKEFRDEALLET